MKTIMLTDDQTKELLEILEFNSQLAKDNLEFNEFPATHPHTIALKLEANIATNLYHTVGVQTND